MLAKHLLQQNGHAYHSVGAREVVAEEYVVVTEVMSSLQNWQDFMPLNYENKVSGVLERCKRGADQSALDGGQHNRPSSPLTCVPLSEAIWP